MLTVLREVLCVFSLRRYRKQGILGAFGAYIYSSISVLLTNTSPSNVPGFVMGGKLYNEKKIPWNEKIVRDVTRHLQSIIKLFQ